MIELNIAEEAKAVTLHWLEYVERMGEARTAKRSLTDRKSQVLLSQ